MGESLEKNGAKCYAWCLIPNHAHMLLKTGEKKLSKIMGGLLSGYATKFNLRHKRSGHLFQNRYKAIICDEEEYFLELIRYIHLNPVRSKIVNDMKELEKYDWTGYSALMRKREQKWQEVGEVLRRFGSRISEARLKFSQFVGEGVKMGKQHKFSGGGLLRSIGGMAGIIENRKSGIMEQHDDRILGSGEFVGAIINSIEQKDKLSAKMKKEYDLEKLIENTAKYFSLTKEQIKGQSRIRIISKARSVLV
ncbi:MAG: hypothetical protein A3J83_07250, partial [Elusimicrobia bacterium RIFOXYA2_FULL_40_6]